MISISPEVHALLSELLQLVDVDDHVFTWHWVMVVQVVQFATQIMGSASVTFRQQI